MGWACSSHLANEFYTNIKVKRRIKKISSKVRGKVVVVTPASIAMYLNYTRPHENNVDYPRNILTLTSLTLSMPRKFMRGPRNLRRGENSNLESSRAPTN